MKENDNDREPFVSSFLAPLFYLLFYSEEIFAVTAVSTKTLVCNLFLELKTNVKIALKRR